MTKVSLGKLADWVKGQVAQGEFETDSEVVREAVRRMKNSQPTETADLQLAMDQAECSGFKRMSIKDWKHLRRLAKAGLPK
jgi:putative addiction module CopG family antidote